MGKTSWENFKRIYNFYLPSLPVIKRWPLQVGLTIVQKSKLLQPGMIEIQKLAMFVMLIWPSLRNIAFAEENKNQKNKKMMHTCVETPGIVAMLSVFQRCDSLNQWHVAPNHSWFTLFVSEKLTPSNVKLFNTVNHAKFFIWNFKWTSLNWYIMLFPLAIWFKWFHA